MIGVKYEYSQSPAPAHLLLPYIHEPLPPPVVLLYLHLNLHGFKRVFHFVITIILVDIVYKIKKREEICQSTMKDNQKMRALL